jgi:hypothetical protein
MHLAQIGGSGFSRSQDQFALADRGDLYQWGPRGTRRSHIIARMDWSASTRIVERSGKCTSFRVSWCKLGKVRVNAGDIDEAACPASEVKV